MKKSVLKKMAAALGFAVALAWGYTGNAAPTVEKPEAALHKAFPNLPVDSIVQTDITGLFEVVSGQNVFYYYPEKEYLFIGEIITTGGKNLTAEKKGGIAAKFVKNLPLDKAVKIGNGKTVVIEFTDPDCPYCRKASEFFKSRTDVTRYAFFSPIAHPAAIMKVYYILNAGDKAKAYQEMFEGKDAVQPASGYSESIKKLAQEHMDLARSAGVTGTPTFFINGKQVVGADMPQIEKLLNDSAQTGK
jgi:thiol:disulfide interchange protein DsbC